ncbi:hypothetical protein AeRB84_000467 [Aphanomyces euteiches]|nr:hypothetical protein AeRB84_000467 [Aphanomyces euteiches]
MDAFLPLAKAIHVAVAPYAAQFSYVFDLLTPLKFRALHAVVDSMASPGVPADVLRYMMCLFGAYPIALFFPLIPSPILKHVFTTGVGIFFAQFVFGSSWVHTLVMAIMTYGIVLAAPRRHIGTIAFFWNMGYLSLSHIYRMYVDYMGVTLEISGAQMVLCMKLTSFAFNYYDGVVDSERIKNPPADNKALAKVFATRRALAINQLPSVIEYLGYVYCFPTLLAGPSFEFREYVDVTNGTKIVGPGRVKAGLSKLAVDLFYCGIMSTGAPYFPFTNFYSEDVAVLPWYQQIATLYVTFFLFKCRFYGCWTVAEGATVLSGFGYEGQADDGSPRWNGVQYMNVWEFELASCHRDSTRKWNRITQGWLEKYIYTRTNNSLTATYFVSAFWHGFYPGYYLFFMLMPLPTLVNRAAHKRLRPWFLEADGSEGTKKRIYDIVGSVANALGIHYIAFPFITLGWDNSIQGYINLKFSGHIILVVLWVIFSFIPVRKDIKTKHE